ncbi:MAG: hypothetical protein WA880_06175 [Ornithinimicrobium sp.]
MSVIALMLLGIGTADAVRTRSWGEAGRSSTIAILSGLSMLVLLAVLADLSTGTDALLLVVAAALISGWVLTSGEDFVRRRGAATPLLILALGCAVLILGSGAASQAAGSVSRWLGWSAWSGAMTDGMDADRVLLLAGLLLIQLATGNVLVRLVLVQVGAIRRPGSPQPSDRLRGGRLLGPMERLVILGLGLAGEVTAASLVIAAKGLIRFPELQHSRQGEGSSLDDSLEVYEVTEYFLIGSFVSWLIALTALAVAMLS